MLDFLKFFLPLAGAVVAWAINEHRKRAAEDYARKELKYAALIESLDGFYSHVSSKEEGLRLKARFLAELNKCWLYCSDDVIRRAYSFLETVHDGEKKSDEVKERAVGELILSIRKDLLARSVVADTTLTASDFKHLMVKAL